MAPGRLLLDLRRRIVIHRQATALDGRVKSGVFFFKIKIDSSWIDDAARNKDRVQAVTTKDDNKLHQLGKTMLDGFFLG